MFIDKMIKICKVYFLIILLHLDIIFEIFILIWFLYKRVIIYFLKNISKFSISIQIISCFSKKILSLYEIMVMKQIIFFIIDKMLPYFKNY